MSIALVLMRSHRDGIDLFPHLMTERAVGVDFCGVNEIESVGDNASTLLIPDCRRGFPMENYDNLKGPVQMMI